MLRRQMYMRSGSEECSATGKLPRAFRSFATFAECTACGRCQDVLQPPLQLSAYAVYDEVVLVISNSKRSFCRIREVHQAADHFKREESLSLQHLSIHIRNSPHIPHE